MFGSEKNHGLRINNVAIVFLEGSRPNDQFVIRANRSRMKPNVTLKKIKGIIIVNVKSMYYISRPFDVS